MNLNFPSMQSLWSDFLKVVTRFPLQILVALAATVSWCLLVDASKRTEEQLILFIVVCNFALTLLLSADLYAEVNQMGPLKRWALRLICLGICIGLYFMLKPSVYFADIYRIGLLAFAFHLLVAFAPFINKGSTKGFWQYNKSLFLRFLTAALYAGVLYAGLAIALVAIDGLFNVKIDSGNYGRLFAIVTAGFMTVFFLAGVPSGFKEMDEDESYPKGLKIFTQYVLIPLMTIYLAILLVYEVKIIINWELPKGLVSTLILGYAVFGILSLLLIHPIKEKTENSWMKLFSRFFYIMMVPLVALLLLAVWKRVDSYGITESRYILIILAAWLSIITVYFLLSKKQNIQVIPISLCILALLATYGPQSAFSVSEYSQVARLKMLMKSTKKEDIKQRRNVVYYLVDRHGLNSLQPFTKVDLRALESTIEQKDTSRFQYLLKDKKIDTAYSLLKIEKQFSDSGHDSFGFTPLEESVISIRGYDYVIPIQSYNQQDTLQINNMDVVIKTLEPAGDLKVKIGEQTAEFQVSEMGNMAKTQVLSGKIKEHSNRGNSYYLPSESLSLYRGMNGLELKLMLRYLQTDNNSGNAPKEKNKVSYNGYLLIKVK